MEDFRDFEDQLFDEETNRKWKKQNLIFLLCIIALAATFLVSFFLPALIAG